MQGARVLVIVGGGSMGAAAARRCGSGARVLLGDIGEAALAAQAEALRADGYDVTTRRTDVSDTASVAELAEVATSLGPVTAIVHTAGVSPVQAPADKVIAVDLLGVRHMLDAFLPAVAPGGAAVVISSMAGTMVPMPPDDEAAVRSAAASELPGLACVQQAAAGDPGLAYSFAKRAAQILVSAAAVPWGRRGARVNSISPGIISTPMGRAELEGPSGDFMRAMVEASGTARYGTPDDIAAAAEFLLSPQASFVTGTDLLVDGGVVAALRSGQLG